MKEVRDNKQADTFTVPQASDVIILVCDCGLRP